MISRPIPLGRLLWISAMAVWLPAVVLAQQPVQVTNCQPGQPYPSTLPDSESGSVPVYVDVFVLNLLEVDDRRSRFVLDFSMALEWQDARLEALADGGTCTAQLAEIWHPHVTFVNSGGAGEQQGIAEIGQGGQVTYWTRDSMEFDVEMDLRRFPFDSQDLVVRIASTLYGPADVRFVPNDTTTGIYQNAGLPGWILGALTSSVPELPITTRTTSHSTIEYTLHVKRQVGFYFWRLMFPLILLILMAWSVFWLEPSQLEPQVTVATGSIFSLMAFLVAQGQILPEVSYTSIADRLIVACVILVFAAFGESVVTGRLAQQGHVELARAVDRYSRWVYLAIIFTIAAATLVAVV